MISCLQNSIKIKFPTSFTSTYHFKWLRDNCMCNSCIHPSTRQKLFASASLTPQKLVPSSISVKNGSLSIKWPSGSIKGSVDEHSSTFPLNWLEQNSYSPIPSNAEFKSHLSDTYLWDNDIYSEKSKGITFDQLLTDEGLKEALIQIKRFGLLFIRNTPENGTLEAAMRFGQVRDTFYGKLWDVQSVDDAKNVAYTSLYLGLHMDLMYFETPPGLQFLHSIKNTATGGESIFADSYKAIDYFKALYPVEFDLLQRQPITFQYRNDNHSMHYIRPIIDTTNPNEPVQCNYSPPFQGPIQFNPGTDIDQFYNALSLFHDTIHMDGMIFSTRLEVGDLVVFNNRRVLHGRNAFSGGNRHLKGCYVDWDCFKDKERVMLYSDL